jgi:hypothetical protein
MSVFGDRLKKSTLMFETVRQEMHVIWKRINPQAVNAALREIYTDQGEVIEKEQLLTDLRKIIAERMPAIRTGLVEFVVKRFISNSSLATSSKRGSIRADEICVLGAFEKYALEYSNNCLCELFKFVLDPKQRSVSVKHSKTLVVPIAEMIRDKLVRPDLQFVSSELRLVEATAKLKKIMETGSKPNVEPKEFTWPELQAIHQRNTLRIQAKISQERSSSYAEDARMRSNRSHRGSSRDFYERPSYEVQPVVSESILNTEYIDNLFTTSNMDLDRSTLKLKRRLEEMRKSMTLEEYNKQLRLSSYESSFRPMKQTGAIQGLSNRMKFLPSPELILKLKEEPEFIPLDAVLEPVKERYKYCSACLLF